MRVRLAADGACDSLLSASLARTKRSTGFDTPSTFGGSGRLTVWRLHQSNPALLPVVLANGSMGSVPHFAPELIHSFSTACSASGSGFFGGMSPADTFFHRLLSS